MTTLAYEEPLAPSVSAPVVVDGLTKAYGERRVVEDLSFSIRAGAVTGFLGPNGAGKTTTLRVLLGLSRPSSGTAELFGRPYSELDSPGLRVGAALEVSGFHPGRSGRDHLRFVAALAGLPTARVDEVLALVELTDAAGRRAGGYSLGMRQRLALATALLGDPELLVLDEPANGLDPPGIRWLRDFLRARAAEGRTVLVSSHMLAEVAQTVDDVVVIARGRLVYEGSIDAMTHRAAGALSVRSDGQGRLAELLVLRGASVEHGPEDDLLVRGAGPRAVAAAARDEEILITRLCEQSASLEDVFLQLTSSEEGGPR